MKSRSRPLSVCGKSHTIQAIGSTSKIHTKGKGFTTTDKTTVKVPLIVNCIISRVRYQHSDCHIGPIAKDVHCSGYRYFQRCIQINNYNNIHISGNYIFSIIKLQPDRLNPRISSTVMLIKTDVEDMGNNLLGTLLFCIFIIFFIYAS